VNDGAWRPISDAAKATLEDLDAVMVDVMRVIRERVPEYAYVPDDELRASSTRNIRSLLQALMERRQLGPSELDFFAHTVEDRARRGVPIDEYLSAVLAAEAEMWEQVWRRAEKVPEGRRAEALNLRFANVNAVTRATVSAHRRIEVVTALEDQERRAIALRALVRGGLEPQDVREHAARLGLAPDRPYWVVRARARGGMDSDQLPRVLAPGSGHAPHAAFVLWGEDTVGLLRDRPAPSSGLIAGVAGPVALSQLARAHEQAALVFDTAWKLGVEGCSDVISLGLCPAVNAMSDVGDGLRERYLAPLFATGHLGEELLTTVRAFLEAGSRRDVAAARLHVHHNTIGYRVNRFVELTGADLTDLTTLAELHWLFTDLDLRPQRQGDFPSQVRS